MAEYPSLKLAKLDTACYELFAVFRRLKGTRLDEGQIDKLTGLIAYELRKYHIPPQNVKHTLQQYIGKALTPQWCQLLSRQLTARASELAIRPLLPFDRPLQSEWVPVEIVKTTATMWNDTKPGQLLTFFCLAGSPAGYSLKRKFPTRWLAWLAYQVGFSRRAMYQDEPHTFIGLRVWAHITPSSNEHQTMDILDWKVSPEMLKHNKLIVRRRLRFDVEPGYTRSGDPSPANCPFDFDHFCHECPKFPSDCEASYRRLAKDTDFDD
jgi:hypothetical protein